MAYWVGHLYHLMDGTFGKRFRKFSATSYTWLFCGEITKLDIWLAAWQLCLRGDGSIICRLGFTETQSMHLFGIFTDKGKK